MSRLTIGDWKDGDVVRYNTGPMKGEGIVVGVATVPLCTIGASVIVEDLSGNLPNDEYPFRIFVCFESQLERVR